MDNSKLPISDLSIILTEGAVAEVIRRKYPGRLDPNISNASLVLDKEGRSILSKIYNAYIQTGLRYKLPTLLFAPTWRCQPHRIELAGYEGGMDLNKRVVDFMKSLIRPFRERGDLYLGAIIGCKGDPYKPEEALSESEAFAYHRHQIQVLSSLDLDVIQVATQPSLSESTGIARLLSEFDVPYILSFMISPEGCLLDTTPISQAIEHIDRVVNHRPLFYMSNCIHPDHFLTAYKNQKNDRAVLEKRFKGLQANTSKLSPDDLNESTKLDLSESPEAFAAKMLLVTSECSLKLIGGCCGTDARHIQHIASGLEH